MLAKVPGTRIVAVAGLIAVSLCLCGCGDGGGVVDLGTVSGTVKLSDQPVPNAMVTFQPAKGRPSFGTTDASGEYELQYTPGNAGALVGEHSVTITTYREGEEDDEGNVAAATPETVPAEYNSKSDLTREVTSGSNTIDFDLKGGGEIIQPDAAGEDDDGGDDGGDDDEICGTVVVRAFFLSV